MEALQGSKEMNMPEHKSKARLEVIKAMKQLAKDMIAEDLGKKTAPAAVSIEVEKMQPVEAMDMEDMDMEDESEEMDSEEESDEMDEDQLKALLKKSKQDSEY